MGLIVVPFDSEEGHTLPQFSLLRHLKAAGHRVCCLGVPEFESLICRQGFEFWPIIVPKRSVRGAKEERENERSLGFLLSGGLDGAMAQLQPDVVMVRSQYYTEGLIIHYRYRIPIVFFNSSFRKLTKARACEIIVTNALMNLREEMAELLELFAKSGVELKGFKDIARLALQFPELMLFPEAFDLPGRAAESGVYYLGAGVDLGRTEEPFQWTGIDPYRPLIYCALGSQGYLQEEASRKLIKVVLETAVARSEWQFIIAIGKNLALEDFAPIPSNVTMNRWVPQLQVLSRATAMINHGGFGTIKECILMRVPMIVFPLFHTRDHAMCAERVVYHGLGVQGDNEQLSVSGLASLIEQVVNDQTFKQQVQLMREKFKQQERLELGAKIIEEVISASLWRAA